MRVYLDLCALKRPYDRPSDDRVVIESLAVARILKAFEGGRVDLVSSSVLELENSKNPIDDRRSEVAEVLARIPTVVRTGPQVLERSTDLTLRGFRAVDALHVASAEAAGCTALVTCDDQLASAARRAVLRVDVLGPVELAAKLEGDSEP